MQIRHHNTFTTIRTEGAILPPDLLQRISEGDSDLGGLKPKNYHLLSGEKINEATNRSWNRLVGAWTSFQEAREHLSEDDPGTTITRERWLLPLFQELDYGRLQTSRAIDLDGKSYPISHTWGQVPIHLVGCNIDLDRRTAGVAGAARTSPHSLVQELLNRSDDYLWSFLSNGLRLRILRDNASLTRQAYVEFDLEAMFEGEIYADFVLLWLLCHQSRIEEENPAEFWLEKWSRYAQEQGTRALDQLRDGVEDAISALGRGFLGHSTNQVLRSKLRQGDLSTQDYYRQLLRMVYRLIFLFVAEDRELLFDPESRQEARQRYTRYYSTNRLRRLAERRRGGRHDDLFVGLRLVMEKLGAETGCPELGLPSLGGFLFSEESVQDIVTCQISNNDLLEAIRSLAYTEDGHALRLVDYKNLGPEEIGSVYESLLELHPEVNVDTRTFSLTTASGHERKTTGSYYTPTSLIQVLLDSALDPVVEDRLRAVKGKRIEEQERALLDIKVCDPASGSGHFLIAAAHRIAKVLAAVRTGDDEPSPEATRRALRDVISRCIYGVDVNPMAVELCKVSLWMEALEPGKPLSFLDAHIKCGNSLLGVGPAMDISEIPDDAFQPAFGDDRATATVLRRRNKREREGQLGFRWDVTLIKDQEDLTRWVASQSQKLETMAEDAPDQVQAKASVYQKLISEPQYLQRRLECDLWTAAFFWPIPKQDAETMLAPTQQELLRLRKGEDLDADLVSHVQAIAKEQRFFHWASEFPTIFYQDGTGFDVILGNPPWERIRFQEQEFFAGLDDEIAQAPNKAARDKLINALPKKNNSLWKSFKKTKHSSESGSKFFRKSNRFIRTAFGDINTYQLFAELVTTIQSDTGRSGIIIPTGISTADSTKHFFDFLVSNNMLVSLYDFLESRDFFIGLESRDPFCLFTVKGRSDQGEIIEFVFKMLELPELHQDVRKVRLMPMDFDLLNPNTKTCPIFYTNVDTEITKTIYSRVPVLDNEAAHQNPWRSSFLRMIDMSLDSNLFVRNLQQAYLPLYESKYIHLFDHRWAAHDGSEARKLSIQEKQNPNCFIYTRYLVPGEEVIRRLEGKWTYEWFIGFRNSARPNDERTAIFSIIPYSGVGNNAPLLLAGDYRPTLLASLFTNMTSLVFDYVTRQKVGGSSLNFFIVRQLPVLPPRTYQSPDIEFIVLRTLELTFTAWDLQPFAQDMGYAGPPFRWDEERRALLRAELDAYYARLYDLNRKQLRYILDPADLTPAELEDILDPWEEVVDPLGPEGYASRAASSTFPGETFRVLKEKEIKQYSEYRTRRLVLEAWDRMQEAIDNGTEYVPMADPPPAHPSMAHLNRDGSVYEDPGLVIDTEMVSIGKSRPATKEQPTGYERKVREKKKEEKPAPKERPPEISDYSLYKCSGCGQMVLGFDREDHIQLLHGGDEQEFVKL